MDILGLMMNIKQTNLIRMKFDFILYEMDILG